MKIILSTMSQRRRPPQKAAIPPFLDYIVEAKVEILSRTKRFTLEKMEECVTVEVTNLPEFEDLLQRLQTMCDIEYDESINPFTHAGYFVVKLLKEEDADMRILLFNDDAD